MRTTSTVEWSWSSLHISTMTPLYPTLSPPQLVSFSHLISETFSSSTSISFFTSQYSFYSCFAIPSLPHFLIFLTFPPPPTPLSPTASGPPPPLPARRPSTQASGENCTFEMIKHCEFHGLRANYVRDFICWTISLIFFPAKSEPIALLDGSRYTAIRKTVFVAFSMNTPQAGTDW